MWVNMVPLIPRVERGSQTKDHKGLLGGVRVELVVGSAQDVNDIGHVADTTKGGEVKSSPTPS